MYILKDPSFFFSNDIGAPYYEEIGIINPIDHTTYYAEDVTIDAYPSLLLLRSVKVLSPKGSMGIKSILNRGFRKLSIQSKMIVPTSRFFPSATSTEYLVSTVDGTMPLKELNSAKVRLLSTRFHALAIITSFALTSGPSEVLSVHESHNLRDSKSLLGKLIEGNLLVLLVITQLE
ncbi:hypothetical protein Tco_0895582 [Tanacetum coccineum]|uniref:Uncharacterized protein n=1 Tax=Tanacetum coccineum TaxID=301880 RepID=A0ABQ5CF06_9ASTR